MGAIMRNRFCLRLTTALIVVVLTRVSAQTQAAQQATEAKTEPGVVFSDGVMISLKPLAPFRADIYKESTLNDGSKITNHHDMVVRDSNGRLYRELQIPAGGFAQTQDEIRIDDPMQHMEYLCHPTTKDCVKIDFQPIKGVRRANMADANMGHDAKFEDLGTIVMNGVVVEGVRVTNVIAADTIGNDRPLTMTQETWYSTELDVDMELKRSDSRTGLQTHTMENVSRGEPDPKYFEPPVGYRLVDMREKSVK
jgi:hypothetical protein